MRVAPALLAIAALLAPASSATCDEEQASAVPSPTRVVIMSENFKTVLHWQYPSMSETPLFTVRFISYNSGSCELVSTCVNISANFCDISREIHKPDASHWFRVQAIVGSQRSNYTEAEEFILRKHGKIGPPKLNLSRHGDEIMVDVYQPAFPPVELLSSIGVDYNQFTYLVTFWDSKNQVLLREEDIPEEDCAMHKCSFSIPIPAEGSTYCVSVKGTSYHPMIVGAPSEESCIHVPLKQTLSTQYIIILCGVIASLSVIFTVYCGCKKLKKKNIKLPKSLVSVIRSLNTESILEPKSDLKYVSVVHNIMPGQSVLPVNDEVTLLEAEPKEESVNLKNSSEGTSSAPPSEAPAKAEEVSVQEGTEQISFDDEQNHKESYFISDSSQMDICSNSSTPEVSATEVQQTVVPSSSLKFSGYDKPHVPLDMLIDVGEDQPVIAYRLTD